MPRMKRPPAVAARGALLGLLLVTACQPSRRADSLRFDLPASLEPARASYEEDVTTALAEVSGFFRSAGFEPAGERLIESVKVFDGPAQAREYLAKEFGTTLENIPETFSGTIEGKTLFLVSRPIYREIWRKLYSDWPWTERSYHQLIVHEVTHRAHESVAISGHGSADAMGPAWFFEGLAVACAGQFETDGPPMGHEELEEQVGNGHTPTVSYPLFGRIVRSLAAEFGMKELIDRASEPGFPEILWSPPARKESGIGL